MTLKRQIQELSIISTELYQTLDKVMAEKQVRIKIESKFSQVE